MKTFKNIKYSKRLITVLLLFMINLAYSQLDSTEWIMPDEARTNSNHLKAAPPNDNCGNATTLPVDGGLDCNGTTFDATLQGGECYTNYGGGSSEHSVWYSFTATNDSLVLAFNRTNYTNYVSPHVRVYGANLGCLPACGTEIYNDLHDGDPGQHTMLTGLTVGDTYLIQVVGNHAGGGNDRHTEFCLGIFTPSENNTVDGSSTIDQCGVSFNGTNTGYTAEDPTPGGENLDGNSGTTCPTCTAGDDVSYVVNNSSWFSFCATTAGDWNITFDGITNCVNAAPNYGLQMTIFRGSPSSLTFIESAPSPSNPGSTWTSSTFSVAAGECIYLVVDGFAGDQCDYSYTLTNVSGGCNLVLPVDLLDFSGNVYNGVNEIWWSTASEKNNNYFILEHSTDGEQWNIIDKINGSGNSSSEIIYNTLHRNIEPTINYYRLKQVDFDGAVTNHGIISIDNRENVLLIKRVNITGQKVNESYHGIVFEYYSDGTVKQVYQK